MKFPIPSLTRKLAVITLLISGFVVLAFPQNQCFSKEEAAKVIASMQAKPTEKKDIRREILKMFEDRGKLQQKIAADVNKNVKLITEYNQLGSTHLLRLCELIKQNGWLSKASIKEDGMEAISQIIANNRFYKLQAQFYPILTEAAKKNLISKGMVASIIDSIRFNVGQPQIFGTQAKIQNNIIYITPLLNEAKVDEWRRQYDLPPLNEFIKQLERNYVLPVLKSPPISLTKASSESGETVSGGISDLDISNDENEVLKIETNLVNLNVRILNKDLSIPANLSLSKEDFSVLEDGKDQEVAFFSTTDAPFDLVLLLDFSGSTIDKRDLIKRSALRFIEVARPSDRIAVVVFTDSAKIVSELTTNRTDLSENIKKMSLDGGSSVWGALKYTYAEILKKQSAGRRSAVVFMTDGVDDGTKTTFADLFEIVKSSDTTIFPVYLDSELIDSDWKAKLYRKAKQSLGLLADESGGQYYYAKKTEDLTGIYEQIINDLGKVYSIGYEPKSDRDGSWRNLIVNIKSRSDLVAKTRKGYFSK